MKIISRYSNLQEVGSTYSPFVLAGAEKTVAFNLESGEMHEQLDSMGFKEVTERVFGVVLDRYVEFNRKNTGKSAG